MINTKKRKGSYQKMIFGLIGGHFLAMIVSFMVSSLLGRFSNTYIITAMHIICLGFAIFFSYHEGWIAGASDKIYISNKKIKYSPAHGFIAGAIASLLNLIIALFSVISALTPLGQLTIGGQSVVEIVYRIWFWPFQIMFNLLDAVTVLHFVPVIVMPCACGIGYIAGIKGFRLLEFIVYKKDNK